MNDTPIRTAEEQAALDALMAEVQAEQEAFDRWLAQPIGDPNPNRWRHHG